MNRNRYLVYQLSDGLVVNVIVLDDLDNYNPGDGLAVEIIPAGSPAWIGWVRDLVTGDYTAPQEELAKLGE